MTTWARNLNNQAVDVVTANPATLFFPTLAAQFVVVPDGTVNGATFAGGVWTNPTVVTPPAPTPVYPTVSVPTFKSLFTFQEEMAIEASADPLVKTFLGRINDPRVTQVDLGLSSVQQGIQYLVTLSILTAARVPQILTGVPQ